MDDYPDIIKEYKSAEGITYRLEAGPEIVSVQGNAMASGDDAFDKECEERIVAELDAGNMLAWCCLRMTASIEGCQTIGTDYLGCVSWWPNEGDTLDDFCEIFAPDMEGEARHDLLQALDNARTALARLEGDTQ